MQKENVVTEKMADLSEVKNCAYKKEGTKLYSFQSLG